MILFFDTETTGLPDETLPADDERQPRLVQLAAILAEEDGTERASISILVDPAAPIPPEASAVHGITDDLVRRAGVSTLAAVAIFDRLAERADLLVAHHIAFDYALLHIATIRVRAEDVFVRKHGTKRRFCTMEASAPVVNLPPTPRMIAAGFNKPKAPKLEECIRHFFGEDLEGAHDALVDVRACARVFFHLQQLQATSKEDAA